MSVGLRFLNMEEWNFITKEDCEKILETYNKCGKYISSSVRSLAEEVEGFLSSHFCLKITYLEDDEEKTQEFFVKKHAQEAGFLAELAASLKVFEKESFMYNLCQEYSKTLQYFENFAPVCYLQKCDCLVIEDLTKSGYQLADKSRKSLTLEECMASLKTIAKYHAYSIAYEEIKSKLLNTNYRLDIVHPKQLQGSFFNGSSEQGPSVEFIKTTIQTLVNLIDIMPEDTCKNKEEFKEMIRKEEIETKLNTSYQNKYRYCCIHGDLWSKNLMFKQKNENTIDCLLIDFQLLRYYMPAYDVVLFLYYNVTVEFRKQNNEKLFKYYYKCLIEELSKNNVDCSSIISYEDLLESSIICAPSAKMQVVNDIALMHLPERVFVEACNNPDMYRKILIEKRTEYFLESAKNDAEFKDTLVEQLLDFKNALEEKERFLNNSHLNR